MSKIERLQIIRSDDGKTPLYAVLPWAQYQALLHASDEDALLIAAGNVARNEERYPADIARRIAAGEVGLKVIREWRGLTQVQLGEAAGVAPQYISQIERDDRNMGIKTASKLASVLNVSPEILLEEPQIVVRSQPRKPALKSRTYD